MTKDQAKVEATKRLFTSPEAAIQMSDGTAQRVVELYRRLRRLVRIEELQGEAARRRLRGALCAPGVELAVGALLSSLTTTNPGGAPRNEEARRQLIFFCNSLHNSRLMQPPSVRTMHSFSTFTPHYAEDVTMSISQL